MDGYMLASYTQTGTIIRHQVQCIYHHSFYSRIFMDGNMLASYTQTRTII